MARIGRDSWLFMTMINRLDMSCSDSIWIMDEVASIGELSCSFWWYQYWQKLLICSYELQIDEGYRSKGIGEHLMKALEKLAKVWSMERIVLTLLTNNDGATRFYKRLGYTLDDTSPDDEPAYDIMSKIIMWNSTWKNWKRMLRN